MEINSATYLTFRWKWRIQTLKHHPLEVIKPEAQSECYITASAHNDIYQDTTSPKDNDLVVFSIGKINDLWWVISCTSGGLTNVKWTWKYPHKKNLKARRISRASVLTNAWPQKELYLRQNVPKRCLSVRLCNIHQSWILMSSLTENGTESILLRNKNTQKPPQMCQIVHVRPRISCRCEQTLTWMSGCQSAVRRKSLPLCSCVQLSPRKKMTFTRLPADAESTQGDRPERRPEY